MRNATSPILTGHLKEYPLSDIFGILRRKRETGRLLIEYPAGPGVFYFKGGELIDAQVGALKGSQAVLSAAKLPESPFNFNPLIEPPAPSINGYQQKVVLRVIGCLDDEVIQNAGTGVEGPLTETHAGAGAATDVSDLRETLLWERITELSARAGDLGRINSRNRLAMYAGALLFLGAVAPIVALTDVFGGKSSPSSAVAERPEPSGPKAVAPEPAAAAESIIGPSGHSEVTLTEGETVSVVQTREKVRHPRRAAATKKSGAEVAIAPDLPPPALQDKKPEGPPKVDKMADPAGSTITVVTRVENGRVVEAYVANRRPGMEAFEASALRAARQRRFPPETKGSEKVVIKVGKQ